MKKALSWCFIVLLCVSLPGNSFAATAQEKLDEMHSYVCEELVKIKKTVDSIIANSDGPVDPPVPPPTDKIPLLKSGHKGFHNFKPGEIKLFKFVGKVSVPTYPIQVGNTPKSQQPHTVHLLVKRGNKPTLKDFIKTWGRAPSDYDKRLKKWIPSKKGVENLYWKYNTGSQSEFIQIKEPMKSNTFYIMLYNKGSKPVRQQRLVLKYWN